MFFFFVFFFLFFFPLLSSYFFKAVRTVIAVTFFYLACQWQVLQLGIYFFILKPNTNLSWVSIPYSKLITSTWSEVKFTNFPYIKFDFLCACIVSLVQFTIDLNLRALLAELRICWLHPLLRAKILLTSSKGFWIYSNLHLVLRLWFWSSGECGAALYCNYSQVHFDPEW